MPPTQLSSQPLPQVSAAAQQLPATHPAAQTWLPEVPQAVRQASVVPAQQPNPSSQLPLQLSSSPLHVSAGGLQAPQLQLGEQLRLPVVPQPVLQGPVAPRQHSPTPSSQMPLQLSSTPLQVSGGGLQVPQLQVELQLRVPLEPQGLLHAPLEPRQHSKSSSHSPSPSSSVPLQASPLALQVPQLQSAPQVRAPGAPSDVVQAPTWPRQHWKPLSQTVSQSSSEPLQVSGGGVQPAPLGTSQASVQVPVPLEPHEVVHETGVPMAHGSPSSVAPSQSSSAPLHDSVGEP
jgi:hypothetical protein